MALSTATRTLLPLDRFAQLVGLHPLHFNGVHVDKMPVCSKTLMQYTWQTADAVSREEIAQAISEAERDLADYIGFPVAPMWVSDERINFTQPYMPELVNPGFPQQLKTRYGHIITGGIEQKVLIDDAAPVVYTDPDGDGYKETATITVTTTLNDLDYEQIAIYYPGHSGDSEWEIRPITVVINMGTATITCRREQLVKESLLTGLTANDVDGLIDTNFLTTVDVYRHYNDPQLQAEFLWSGSCTYCSGSGCNACVYIAQNGCIRVNNNKLGLVIPNPGAWNVSTQQFDTAVYTECRQPDRVRLWYQAGWRDMSLATHNITMDRIWAQAVSRLALTKLDRPICSCHAVSQTMQHWTLDVREAVGTAAKNVSRKATTYELDNCPFGTTLAGLDVWRMARRYASGY